MSREIQVSHIITTYNWPEALQVTLASAVNQSLEPDEIIIADDGSKALTAKTIEDVLRPTGLRWCHVRHADQGVRQSRIKNLAVKNARFPYLIFTDQDVVLHPRFVTDHVVMARQGTFLQGKRSLLSENLTREVLFNGTLSLPQFFRRGLRNKKNTFRSPKLGRLFSRTKTFETSLRGCNLSMFKSDFLKVDGFDETFDGSWGREDSDICYRLLHAGIRVKTLWFMALQYHLYHGIILNWDRERLDGELDRNLKEKRVTALQGFSQLSSEGEIVTASDEWF